VMFWYWCCRMLMPREAGKFISGVAKDVFIKGEGVTKVANIIAEAVKNGKLDPESFKQNEVLPLDKGLTNQQLSDWIFLVDAINFNFWTPNGVPKYVVKHNGVKRAGYLGMVLAVNRAIDEGKPMYDPNYYSKLTVADLKNIFRSETKSLLPLFEERVKVLKAVGEKLIEKYDGSFLNVLKLAEGSAMKLVKLIMDEFEPFRDTAVIEGQEVALLKRAQIVAADIWMLYCGQDLGSFADIDSLTMFADYRVPQAMVHFGALKYSTSLMNKLENEYLFKSGEREEVEIRGASIHATELIVAETRKILESLGLSPNGINSIKVDFFLWDYRVSNSKMLEPVPYHRVRCIYY
ncbi:unnamed protein product, partial [Meganyctiphanes norvegica]